MLVDSCMERLSPNAWKVICYVAAKHLRVHDEYLECFANPALFWIRRDLETGAGIIHPSGESRPYRTVTDGPRLPGCEGPARLAVISLNELCHGVRLKKCWQDYGTGLSKSSAAAAINEAIRSGFLVRQRNRSSSGRDLSSLYAVDWDRVQEADWTRRKRLKRVSRSRTRKTGENDGH